MKNYRIYLFSLFGLLLVLASCRGQARKYPPYQTKMYTQQTSDRARQNVMVADMQLAKSRSYYSRYQTTDQVVSNAVQAYDQGNVVINIYLFDLVQINQDVFEVVYGGTQTVANGDDMVMAEDIGGVNNEEARIRYMLADMQLGEVVDYYRQFTKDLAIAEAVKRWDRGVRVSNIDQFERVIVVQAGWKVVYKGTLNTINGMDVILTSDGSQASGGTGSGSSENDDLETLCGKNNPMIKPGATWTYGIASTARVRLPGASDWTTTETSGVLVTVTINDSMQMLAEWQNNGQERTDGPWDLTVEDCTNPPYFFFSHYSLDACQKLEPQPVMSGNVLSCGPYSWTGEDGGYTYTWTDSISYIFDPVLGITKAELDHDTEKNDGYIARQHTIYTLTSSNLGNVPAAPPTNHQDLCNNPYFPVIEGESWSLQDSSGGPTYSMSIDSIQANPNGGGSFVRTFTGSSETDTCDGSGAIWDGYGSLLLPPASELRADNVYHDPHSGLSYHIYQSDDAVTPAGTFSPCYYLIVVGTDMMPLFPTFCEGVGVAEIATDTLPLKLVNHFTP